MSFFIPPGETWALVGSSGSGKSTISRLLTGLVTPTSGTVLIGGKPLELIGRKQVRRIIGSVSQECILFNESLRENVRYSRQEFLKFFLYFYKDKFKIFNYTPTAYLDSFN